jgi:hypothetical protein
MKYTAAERTVDVTATGTQDIDVRDADKIRLYVKLATLTGGAAPTVDFSLVALHEPTAGTFVEGPELAAMGAALAAVDAIADAGVIDVPSEYVRLKWTTANGPTSATAFLVAWGVR